MKPTCLEWISLDCKHLTAAPVPRASAAPHLGGKHKAPMAKTSARSIHQREREELEALQRINRILNATLDVRSAHSSGV